MFLPSPFRDECAGITGRAYGPATDREVLLKDRRICQPELQISRELARAVGKLHQDATRCLRLPGTGIEQHLQYMNYPQIADPETARARNIKTAGFIAVVEVF